MVSPDDEDIYALMDEENKDEFVDYKNAIKRKHAKMRFQNVALRAKLKTTTKLNKARFYSDVSCSSSWNLASFIIDSILGFPGKPSWEGWGFWQVGAGEGGTDCLKAGQPQQV
jgi:hypothetical protein